MPVIKADETEATILAALQDKIDDASSGLKLELGRKIALVQSQLKMIATYLTIRRDFYLEQIVELNDISAQQVSFPVATTAISPELKNWIDAELQSEQLNSFEAIGANFKALVLGEADQDSDILLNLLKNAWLDYTQLMQEIKANLAAKRQVSDFFKAINDYLSVRQTINQATLDRLNALCLRIATEVPAIMQDALSVVAVQNSTIDVMPKTYLAIHANLDHLISAALQVQDSNAFETIKSFCDNTVRQHLEYDNAQVTRLVSREWGCTVKLLQNLYIQQQQLIKSQQELQQRFELAERCEDFLGQLNTRKLYYTEKFAELRLIEQALNQREETLFENADLKLSEQIDVIASASPPDFFVLNPRLKKTITEELAPNSSVAFELTARVFKGQLAEYFGSSFKPLIIQFEKHWSIAHDLLISLLTTDNALAKKLRELKAVLDEKRTAYYFHPITADFTNVSLSDCENELEELVEKICNYLSEKLNRCEYSSEKVKKVRYEIEQIGLAASPTSLSISREELNAVKRTDYIDSAALDVRIVQLLDAAINKTYLINTARTVDFVEITDFREVVSNLEIIINQLHPQAENEVQLVLKQHSMTIVNLLKRISVGKRVMTNNVESSDLAVTESDRRASVTLANRKQLPTLFRTASAEAPKPPALRLSKSLSESCAVLAEKSDGYAEKAKISIVRFFAPWRLKDSLAINDRKFIKSNS